MLDRNDSDANELTGNVDVEQLKVFNVADNAYAMRHLQPLKSTTEAGHRQMTKRSRYNEAAEGEMDYVASKINESAVRTSNRSQAALPKCLQSELTGFLPEDISRNTPNAEHFAPDYYRDNNPNIRMNTITFAPSAWAN